MKSSIENVTQVPDNIGTRAPLPRRLNTDQAAWYLGLSVSKVNKLRHYGRGPKYYKLGTRVVYDPADLDACVASFAQTNTSQNRAS